MRRIVILWHIIGLPLWAAGQVCGLEDTLWINPDATHTYTIAIDGLVNNNLADPAQGVCGVEIEFVHQFVENLEIWLTSPNGDMVQLIGPNTDDPLAFTFFAYWDISFVRCGATASPDFGYAAQWNNNQTLNFVSGGRYTGSYYPFSGCLENFNSGPVNGNWTITVVNNPSPFYGGAILDFRLVFCDVRGIDCCFADPGLWRNPPDLTVCRGADTLSALPVQPFYSGRRPDSTLFGYYYVVAKDGFIVAYDTALDLSAGLPGSYQICGLSFERATAAGIPSPADSITIDSLRNNLESFTPAFCGELTSACATVVIVPPPDTTFLAPVLCFGDTAYIGDTAYTATGRYVQTLPGLGGCDSIVQLDLTILPLPFTALDLVICEGDSVVVGDTAFRQSGFYIQMLRAATGCDSIVELDLEVLAPVAVVLDTIICEGDSVRVGAEIFGQSGTYTVLLASSRGCDSIVTLNLSVFGLQALITGADTLTCDLPQLTLDGSGSSPPAGLNYLWRSAAGDSIGAGPALAVTMPGWYVLELRPESGSPACVERDSVWIPEDRAVPVADAGPDSTLTCATSMLTLGGGQTSTSSRMTFVWSTDTGVFSSPNGQPTIQAAGAGRYVLTVRDTVNGCSAADTLILDADTLPPPALAGPDDSLTCIRPSLTLAGSSSGANIAFLWTGPCIEGDPGQETIEVSCAGAYVLRVTDLQNTCTAFDTVWIAWDTIRPIPDAGPPQVVTCADPAPVLQGSVIAAGSNLSFSWSGPGIVSGADDPACIVDVPGTYYLLVLDAGNGCTGLDSVSVSIDTIAPVSDAGPERRLDCTANVVTLGGAGTSTGPDIRQVWTTFGGNLSGPVDQPFTAADAPGIYILMVENVGNGCADTSNVLVTLDLTPPLANAGEEFILTCDIREAVLDGSGSASGPFITYAWAGPCLSGAATGAVASADCPGIYTLTVTDLHNGCTAFDTTSVFLAQATALAVLPDTLRLSCVTGTVQIDGSASVYGVFEWEYNGAPAAISDIDPVVNAPGIYVLRVNTLALNCPDADTTVVLLECAVDARIETPDTLTCFQATIALDARASSSGPGISYQWSGPAAGCIAAGQGTPLVQVVCPGAYQLIVRNTATGIADTAGVTVFSEQVAPLAEAGPADSITCRKTFGVLDGSGSSMGDRFLYTWTDAAGNVVSTAITDTTMQPGGYFFEVLDTVNGCSAVDFVTITQFIAPVAINFGNTVFPCNRDSFLLRAFPDPPGLPYVFDWTGPGLLSGVNTAEIWIDTAGLYAVSVTDSISGCSVQNSVTVTQPECGPCIRIAPPDTVTCSVQSILLSASFCEPCPGCTFSWTALSGEILSGENTLTPRVGAGSYMLTATDTLGITATLTVDVIAMNTPPAVDAGPDLNITCRDSLAMLGGPGSATGSRIRYQWTTLAGAPVIPADELFGAANSPGLYVLEITDLATGCSALDTVRVGLDTIHPAADAGPDKLITCATPFAIPDGDGSSLGSAIAYLWTTVAPGIIAAGDTTLNPILTAPGVYLLRVVNTLNGCFDIDSMQVTLSAQLPFVPAIPEQVLTCADSVAVLSPAIADTSGLGFQWCRVESGNTFADCTAGLSRRVQTPGIYRFEVTDSLTGCRNTGFATVSENKALPLVDAGDTPGVLSCTQMFLTLSGSVSPAGIPVDVLWSSSGGGEAIPPDALDPVVNTPGVYLLRATRRDNGCSAMDSVVVSLDDNFPVADAGPDTALSCRVIELRLQAAAQTTGAPVQWSWSTPDGQILDGAATPAPRINRPGTYFLTITDPANGCMASDSVIVVLDRDVPDIHIDAPQGLSLNCTLSALVLDAGASISGTGAALAFQWFGTPGSIIGSMDSAKVQIGSVGFYRLIAENTANGCRDTALVQIGADFQAPSVVVFSSPALTCARLETVLTGAASPPGSFLRYAWVLPGGDTAFTSQAVFTADVPGIYRLVVTDTRNGCSGAASTTVAQDILPPTAFVIPPGALDCDQPVVTMDAASSSGRGTIFFQWTGPPGGIIDGDMAARASVALPGLYRLIVTDDFNGCSDTTQVEVLQLSVPITGLEMTLMEPSCPGAGDGEIRVNGILGGTAPFSSVFNGASTGSILDFTYLLPGNYTLRVLDAQGCYFDTTIVLPDPPLLTVDLGPDQTVVLGDSILLEALTGPQPVRYRWTPAELFPDAVDSAAQVVRPVENTTYGVTIVNGNGCTASDQVTVFVNAQNLYFVPNVFSPNGDGNNDVFFVFASAAVANIRALHIFDRWGNQVFFRQDFPPNDPAFGWDGTFEGRPLDPAVFLVTAELELHGGRAERFSGELVLLR